MKSTIFNAFEVKNAMSFRDSFDTNNVYLWIGGPNSWPNENSPPQYDANIVNEISARNNMAMLVKLAKTDTILSIKRYNWTLNTVYAQYSDTDGALFGKQFYVMTSAGNVYKCISNNNGAQSVNTPIGTSVNTLILADGYQWKFMYNLSIDISLKFLISEYIPTPSDLSMKTAFQTDVEAAAVFTTHSPPKGHGYDASVELGATNITIAKEIIAETLAFTIPTHRQFGLIVNPKLMNSNLATDSVYNILDSNNTIDIQSGTLLNLVNHQSVTNTGQQNEIVQFVINF